MITNEMHLKLARDEMGDADFRSYIKDTFQPKFHRPISIQVFVYRDYVEIIINNRYLTAEQHKMLLDELIFSGDYVRKDF